jgi:ABC-type multidrug transport system permease subunit
MWHKGLWWLKEGVGLYLHPCRLVLVLVLVLVLALALALVLVLVLVLLWRRNSSMSSAAVVTPLSGTSSVMILRSNTQTAHRALQVARLCVATDASGNTERITQHIRTSISWNLCIEIDFGTPGWGSQW